MRKQEKKLLPIAVKISLMLMVWLLLVTIPTLLITYFYVQNGIEQVNQTNTWLLKNYISQIDRELDMAETYMNSLLYQNHSTVYLLDRDEADFYYSANELNLEIRKMILNYQYISGFFLYIPDTDFEYTYIKDAQTLQIEQKVQEYLFGEYCQKILTNTDWSYVEINGVPFLVQGFTGNGIYGGAFLNLRQISRPKNIGDRKEVNFCSNDQVDNVKEDIENGNIFLEAESEHAPFCIYTVASRRDTLSSLPFLQRYAMAIMIEILLMLMLSYIALRKWVVFPLGRLSDAMKKIEKGNLDHQIPKGAKSAEFAQIESTFNHMMTEIKDLKIKVYEEQLQIQKTQLQNLSYQLRPHFMINSLNMVYNLILSRDYEGARKLIRFSVMYLRYLLKNMDDFVLLEDELAHLENYLNIQKLRYENQFCYTIEVESFVKDIEIPSMLLQNFVENSIKYSIGPDHFTTIEVKVGYVEKENVSYAQLIIRDNGNGYPEWLLKALQEEDFHVLEERVGLKNNLLRIKMLFQNHAVCKFYNADGAVTEFMFPL